MDSLTPALDEVGPRLRAHRHDAELTLADLSRTTGISVSTLSRLESGQRRPTLELLLPLARAYGVALDDLVGPETPVDPRVHAAPYRSHGMRVQPLTRRPTGPQVFRLTIPAGSRRRPEQQSHDGWDWIYVMSGRLRLLLGPHDLVVEPGEAAEFDTRVPHWFGSADGLVVEALSIFSHDGEAVHLRARARSRPGS